MRGRDRYLRGAHRFALETFGRRPQSPAGERHLMVGLGTRKVDITIATNRCEVFLAANSAGTLTNATSVILGFIGIPLRATRVAFEQPSCLRRRGLQPVDRERRSQPAAISATAHRYGLMMTVAFGAGGYFSNIFETRRLIRFSTCDGFDIGWTLFALIPRHTS